METLAVTLRRPLLIEGRRVILPKSVSNQLTRFSAFPSRGRALSGKQIYYELK
jgi:hypothetical protein